MKITVDEKEELAGLWELFRGRGDQGAREQLILTYVSLVKRIAGRLAIFFHGYYDLDELISAGIPGLIGAVDKFNPDKGVKFETFATIKVKGTIIDWVRSFSWVPRTVYAEARNVEKALATLEQQLGRSPDDSEVADYLELTVEEYRQLLNKISPVVLVSFDDPQNQSSESIVGVNSESDTDGVIESLDLEDQKRSLAMGIDRLPEREKLVVSLYYYDGLTLKEIGRVLDVSESRVAQIHAKALLKLRQFLQART